MRNAHQKERERHERFNGGFGFSDVDHDRIPLVPLALGVMRKTLNLNGGVNRQALHRDG